MIGAENCQDNFQKLKKVISYHSAKPYKNHNKPRDLEITAGEMSDNLRNTVNGLACMGVCRFPKQTARFNHLFKNRAVEISYTLYIVNSIIFQVRTEKSCIFSDVFPVWFLMLFCCCYLNIHGNMKDCNEKKQIKLRSGEERLPLKIVIHVY